MHGELRHDDHERRTANYNEHLAAVVHDDADHEGVSTEEGTEADDSPSRSYAEHKARQAIDRHRARSRSDRPDDAAAHREPADNPARTER